MIKKEIMRLTERLQNADVIVSKINEIIKIKEDSSSTSTDKQTAANLSAEVLKEIFDNGYDYAIPGEFLDSELGELLFMMKFDVGEKEFNMSQAGEVIGVSRQRMGQLIQEGKINYKIERNKKIIGYSDLVKYISIYCPISDEEIEDRIEKVESKRNKQ